MVKNNINVLYAGYRDKTSNLVKNIPVEDKRVSNDLGTPLIKGSKKIYILKRNR